MRQEKYFLQVGPTGHVTVTQFDAIIAGLNELSRNPDSYFSPAALGQVAGIK